MTANMTASLGEPAERTASANLTQSNTSNTMRYRCVQCLEPAETLYRTYTRESTIKLSQCAVCGNNVDNYCEREWLLVVIDIVLLREEAYRHVIFNRLRDFNVRENYSKSLHFVVGSSVLNAYLLWEAHSSSQHPDDPILESSVWFGILILASCLRLFAFGLGIFGTLQWLLFVRRQQVADPDMTTHVYLAVLLPTACQVVTILVQIWENTATVRLLGSLLTLCYQWMAMTVVVASCLQSTTTTTTTIKSNDSWIWSLLPITVGLLVRAGVDLVWTFLWTGTAPLPCVGLPWLLPGTTSTSVCIP